MKQRSRRLGARTVCALLCAALSACTTQAWYQGLQYSQHQQCQKIDDRDERTRCEKAAALPYDEYREQSVGQKTP